MKKYVCTVCGWVYDELEGLPDEGIAPGTAFADLPDDFVCPICGVGRISSRKSKGRVFLSVSKGRALRPAFCLCKILGQGQKLFFDRMGYNVFVILS